MFNRLFAAALLCCVCLSAFAQSPTAFTYQGQLTSAGANVTGTADLQFRLFDAATGGNQVGPQVAASNVTLSAGRFTTDLDFGSAFAAGQQLWLEIDVRSPAGSGAFTTLAPREAVTPAPLAQALVGVPISPTGGSPVLDLDQSAPLGGAVRLLPPSWQSFTADRSANLGRIDLDLYFLDVPSPVVTINIYSGVGTAGALLATVTKTPTKQGPLSFDGFSVPMTAGQQYTFAMNGAHGFSYVQNGLPGTSGMRGGGSFNWWFRTYTQGPLLSAASSDSQMLLGKPASAYQPPTVQTWAVQNLPSTSYVASSVTTISSMTRTFGLGAGTAVISWSTSARVSLSGVFTFRVRVGSNVGPWTYFAFNQVNVHTTISGNAAIAVPSTGDYQISLEIQSNSGAQYTIDQNDSLTATVLNILQ